MDNLLWEGMDSLTMPSLCHVIKYSLKPEFNRAGLYIPTIALVPTLRDCQSQTAA
jgi:hypothetical protein